jgi:hypothetical protein
VNDLGRAPGPPRDLVARGGAAGLLALGGALWANALGHDLVWDDRLLAAVPSDAWTIAGARTGAYYRPLVLASFALDRGVFGGAPLAFHATNVVLHVAVAWLVLRLATAAGLRAGAAFASAALFLAHPVQTEAVTYVSGRTDVLGALGALGGVLLWRRARSVADRYALASAAAFLAGLLAKESVVLVPLVLLLPAAHPGPERPRPILPIAAALAWLVAWAVSGGPGVRLDGFVARLPAVAGGALTLARLVVWPADLHLERFTAVTGWTALGAAGAFAGVAALLAALALAARQGPGGGLLLALAVLAYLPVAGLVPVYPAIADRVLFTAEHFLYLPLAGVVPLGVGALAPRLGRRAGIAAAIACVAACGAVTVDRNRDWQNEETIFRHTLAYDPPSARVWYNLGNTALAAGRLDEAVRLYGAAVAREPHDAAAWLNLGIARQRQGDGPGAEAAYRAALAADPHRAEAYRGLAGVLARRGALDEAARMAERWQAESGSGRQ